MNLLDHFTVDEIAFLEERHPNCSASDNCREYRRLYARVQAIARQHGVTVRAVWFLIHHDIMNRDALVKFINTEAPLHYFRNCGYKTEKELKALAGDGLLVRDRRKENYLLTKQGYGL